MKHIGVLSFVLYLILSGCCFSAIQKNNIENLKYRKLEKLFYKGLNTDKYKTKILFVESAGTLSDKRRNEFFNEYKNGQIYKDFYSGILNLFSSYKPSDSLFIYYCYAMENIIQYDAHGSEEMTISFNEYFYKYINISLKNLNKIKNKKIVEYVVWILSEDEDNFIKIIKYIKLNKLTNNKYYKIFLKYKY